MSDQTRLAALTSLFGSDEFEGVSIETLARLAGEMEWVRVGAGDTLLREGEVSDDVFFLVAGRLRVFVSHGDEIEAVSDIVPGETVGEMELISRKPCSATVCAVRDAQLLRLGRASFLEAAKHHPQMYASMVRQLVQRLEERNRPRRDPGAVTIALVALTGGVPWMQVAQSLTEALKTFGSSALIASDTEGNPHSAERRWPSRIGRAPE